MTLKTERRLRAKKIVIYLKKAYPAPKTELLYETPFQLLVAVVLSAQCTDKAVNKATRGFFPHVKTPGDFSVLTQVEFEKHIRTLPFFRNKAKHLIAAAKIIEKTFGGKVPEHESDLVKLPGVGYKTAHVIAGELYEKWEGIPTDTHVKRFAYRFDLSDNKDLKKISKDLEALVPKKDWKFVNNGLVLYGRYVCRARKHDCSQHPLSKIWPPSVARWQAAK